MVSGTATIRSTRLAHREVFAWCLSGANWSNRKGSLAIGLGCNTGCGYQQWGASLCGGVTIVIGNVVAILILDRHHAGTVELKLWLRSTRRQISLLHTRDVVAHAQGIAIIVHLIFWVKAAGVVRIERKLELLGLVGTGDDIAFLVRQLQ